MVIGSGLLAKAFAARFAASPRVWVYAAGVSNSGCTDQPEFQRERARLSEALKSGAGADAFVYFSTCSVRDPNAGSSAYVRHKIEMEKRVSEHAAFVVIRLPQLAGRTPNPHTLLNYLYARIARSESFVLWTKATRNIIDVADAAAIVTRILENAGMRRCTINVANPTSHSISEIVAEMEKVTGKQAITEQIDAGAPYQIDTSQIAQVIAALGMTFDSQYLSRVIREYYGQEDRK